MKRENMPEMTYRHITMMIWSVTMPGESNSLNSAATSNEQIVEGLQNSAAAMAAMGSSFEENVALFTAAQEITQDASKVGNALRTISMRIRGRLSLPPYKEIYMLCA